MAERIKASEMRKGDAIWWHMARWDVAYVSQADRTATVKALLVSPRVAGCVMSPDFHPSELVQRVEQAQ